MSSCLCVHVHSGLGLSCIWNKCAFSGESPTRSCVCLVLPIFVPTECSGGGSGAPNRSRT